METKKEIIENIKAIIKANGHKVPDNQYLLDVTGHAAITGMHLDGNVPDNRNTHFIESCDIDDDGDFYVLFTDCSEKFYEYDFSMNELRQILAILTEVRS